MQMNIFSYSNIQNVQLVSLEVSIVSICENYLGVEIRLDIMDHMSEDITADIIVNVPLSISIISIKIMKRI